MREVVEGGAFELDGVPVGAWRVVVGPSGSGLVDVVWARGDVAVRAGETSEIRVAVVAKGVDVEIELDVAPEWREQDLAVHLMGCTERNRGVGGSVTFSKPLSAAARRPLGGLEPGTYEVIVSPIDWQWLVRVRKSGEVIRVPVPPAGQLRVNVADEAGKPVSGDVRVRIRLPGALDDDVLRGRFGWVEDGGDRPRRWGSAGPALSRDADGSYAGTVISGDGELCVSAPGYCDHEESIRVLPGKELRSIDVRLRRGATIDVRLVDGGRTLTSFDDMVSLFPMREPGVGYTSRATSVAKGHAVFTGLDAGSYEVTIGTIANAPSKTVHVRAGERVDVDLDLTPPK